MARIGLAVLALLSIVASAHAQEVNCDRMVKLHAYLSRAQFQCGFNQYNEELINIGRVCAAERGEDWLKERLMGGFKAFNDQAELRGQAVACRAILRDYPNYVRK